MVPTISPAVGSPPALGLTLGECISGCQSDAACKYWMYNKESLTCTFHALMIVEGEREHYHIVTGEKECSGPRNLLIN